MARPRTNPSAIAIFRMNQGKNIKTVVAASRLSRTTVERLENGGDVTREYAARYFLALEVDLNKSETIPATVKIVDLGGRIKVLSKQ